MLPAASYIYTAYFCMYSLTLLLMPYYSSQLRLLHLSCQIYWGRLTIAVLKLQRKLRQSTNVPDLSQGLRLFDKFVASLDLSCFFRPTIGLFCMAELRQNGVFLVQNIASNPCPYAIGRKKCLNRAFSNTFLAHTQ